LLRVLPANSDKRKPTRGLDPLTSSPYERCSIAEGTALRRVRYYPTPIPAAAGIEGHLCFFNEKVDLEVDGEVRLRTQWS
jgi:hypothetical protein